MKQISAFFWQNKGFSNKDLNIPQPCHTVKPSIFTYHSDKKLSNQPASFTTRLPSWGKVIQLKRKFSFLEKIGKHYRLVVSKRWKRQKGKTEKPFSFPKRKSSTVKVLLQVHLCLSSFFHFVLLPESVTWLRVEPAERHTKVYLDFQSADYYLSPACISFSAIFHLPCFFPGCWLLENCQP